MKIRFNKRGTDWDECQFCPEHKKANVFTIFFKGTKLVKKLCESCARYLSEFGTKDDLDDLWRQR